MPENKRTKYAINYVNIQSKLCKYSHRQIIFLITFNNILRIFLQYSA